MISINSKGISKILVPSARVVNYREKEINWYIKWKGFLFSLYSLWFCLLHLYNQPSDQRYGPILW